MFLADTNCLKLASEIIVRLTKDIDTLKAMNAIDETKLSKMLVRFKQINLISLIAAFPHCSFSIHFAFIFNHKCTHLFYLNFILFFTVSFYWRQGKSRLSRDWDARTPYSCWKVEITLYEALSFQQIATARTSTCCQKYFHKSDSFLSFVDMPRTPSCNWYNQH